MIKDNSLFVHIYLALYPKWMDKMVTQIHNKHYQRSDELGKKKDSFGGVENVAKVIKTMTHIYNLIMEIIVKKRRLETCLIKKFGTNY